jgi:hypothetical protein
VRALAKVKNAGRPGGVPARSSRERAHRRPVPQWEWLAGSASAARVCGAGRRLGQGLDEMHILHVRCDMRPDCCDIVRVARLRGHRGLESLVQAVLGLSRDHLAHRLELTARERLVRRGDRRLDVAGRLQTRVGCSLAGAVHAHERFEEPAIGELPGGSSASPHGERLLKSAPDLRFVGCADPAKHRIRIARLQRRARLAHERSIHRVAMRLGGAAPGERSDGRDGGQGLMERNAEEVLHGASSRETER